MKDVVEDKAKIFGMFASKPENIVILPGPKPVFEKFVQGVKNLKNPKKKSHLKPKNKTIMKAKEKAAQNEKVIKIPTIEDLTLQMKSWMSKQSIQKPFAFENTTNPSTFLFICSNCKWKNHVTSNAKGTVCLSNVQKHFRSSERCKKIKTNTLSTASKTIPQFFKKPSASSSKSQSIFNEEQRNLEPIHDNSGVDFNSEVDLTKDTEEESMETNDTGSKNLQLPVGHLENIETNGH